MRFITLASIFSVAVLAQTTSPTCAVATATPSPKATICGQEGSVDGHLSLTVSPERTVDDCRNLCLADSLCKSFGYNKTNTICTSYSGTPKQQSFKPGKTSTFFWSKKCFKETCHCDPNPETDAPDLCGHLCVDKRFDDSNCGKCGNKCEAGYDCIAGSCIKPLDRCNKPMPTCLRDTRLYKCGPGADRGGSPCLCYDEEGKKDAGYCLSDPSFGRSCRYSSDCNGDEFCSYNSCYGSPVCIQRSFDCNNQLAASKLFRRSAD